MKKFLLSKSRVTDFEGQQVIFTRGTTSWGERQLEAEGVLRQGGAIPPLPSQKGQVLLGPGMPLTCRNKRASNFCMGITWFLNLVTNSHKKMQAE